MFSPLYIAIVLELAPVISSPAPVVDTGNNLYDPYKKRPVIIVSDKYIKEDKYILVPYHTISGNGLLKCIKPDIIFIDGIGYKGNVLIGFSDSFNFGDGVDVILHKDIMKG